MANILKTFVLILACIFCMNPVVAQDDDASFHLVVFGDSLSSGYRLPPDKGFIPVLQKKLASMGLDNVSVINAAVAGDTTENALKRIDAVMEMDPHAVIIEFGINDVLNDIPFSTAEKNLDQIVHTFRRKDIPVLLVGMRAPFLTDQKSREDFIWMYKRTAKKYKVAFYPYFLEGVLIDNFGLYDLKYMQDDGAHPNEQGVQIMVDKFTPFLYKFLTDI